VDMDSPQPYRALLKQMNSLMDEMEKLVAEGVGQAAAATDVPAAATQTTGG